MPEYMPQSARPYMPRSARPVQRAPEVGGGETFLNRAVGMIPGANRLTDAISALALEAGSSGGTRATLTPEARAELQAMGEEVPEEPGLVDRYREVRDRRAERTEAGSEQNPWAGRAGALTGFGLSLLAPLPKASGTGLGAAVKTGAGYGAFQGLTEGGADLTRGEYGQAALDTLGGAATGGLLGAGFHGAMRLGQRGVQALRGARQEVLSQETAAAREAAEEGQAAAAKAFEKERREIGGAREMNKAFDKKRAKELVQRARGGGQPSASGAEDPSTKVLKGYSAQARQAQMSRSKEVERLQQKINDPQYPTKVSEDWQRYIDEMPKAAETGPTADPAGLRRQFMERHLRQKYGDEMAERLMRERVGPGGEVLPRAAPQPAAAPELSAQPQLGPGQDQLPLLPALESAPAVRQLPSPLAPMPTPREGANAMPFGRNLRPEPLPPEPTTQLATQSMAAPRDVPLEAMPTRAASVPNVQRPTAPAAPPPAEVPTVPGRPALPAGAPPPAAPPPVADELQDVTRLAGQGDIAPLAAERAAAREQDAFRAVGRAGYEGVKAGQSTLGAIVGGIGGVTREMLKDPAVKARVLAAARLHVLARINPALAARVSAQLQSAGPRQRAAEHLLARKDPEYREAKQKAAEQVASMTDEQLLALFASAGQPQ